MHPKVWRAVPHPIEHAIPNFVGWSRACHPHEMQDLLPTLAFHNPNPIRVTGVRDNPQLIDVVGA